MNLRSAASICLVGLSPLAATSASPTQLAPQPAVTVEGDPRTAALRSLPWPDLEGLESAVRDALRGGLAALDRAPGESASWGELGRLLQAQGFPIAAEVCYDNAAHLDPEEFRWSHLRGLVLLEQQRLEEAAASFAEAFSRRPYYPALLRQARVELDLGHLERAKSRLAIAASHTDSDPALLALLADQAALEGDPAAAIDFLSRALASAPEANRLHYPLSLAYRALGEVELADRHLARAGRIGIVPLDPVADEVRARRVGATAWDLEGQRALQAGDARAAIAAFRKALDARPDDPELLARLRAAETALTGARR